MPNEVGSANSLFQGRLGYSRRFHVMAAPCQDAEHTYESVVRAFGWFGGATDDVLVDNQRSAVLSHHRSDVRFNPGFKALAKHYGFVPKACRPYRVRTKGKVERLVGYMKHHFFARYRSFKSIAHLNQLLEAWLLGEADQRVHGTVKEVVATRFEREVPALKPLPPSRFETTTMNIVRWNEMARQKGRKTAQHKPLPMNLSR